MNKQINVALIYKASCDFMTGTFFANTYYHFFMEALKGNSRINVTYFSAEKSFDTKPLNGKYDIILLPDNTPHGTPDELIGIKQLDIPVISRVNDPQDALREDKKQFHERYKIDYYFGYIPEDYFYKYYPKSYKYKVILYGLESSLYNNVTPFNQRIKNKILCSGAAESRKLYNRLYERIMRWRGDLSLHKHYKLRSKCIGLPYVNYTSTLQHEYVGDKYPLLLSKYASSIAASTLFPVIKYMEIPAAGCLTFMEVTDKNKASILGFKDEETAIFINEKNYKSKFEEFLSDADNPKWEQIASAGRQYVLKELNNDMAVESLVNLMEELL